MITKIKKIKSRYRSRLNPHPAAIIPIHLGVTPRSPLLRTDHTPEGFRQRLRKANLTEIIVLQEGEAWTF